MNWRNLATRNCPHCGNKLGDKPEEDGLIHCIQCRFSLSEEKLRSMTIHRSKDFVPKVKMKWQNLHECRCPVCGQFLKDGNGIYNVLVCMSSTCDFRIREDRMEEILKDPGHVANLFYQKLDEEIDRNLRDLNNL